MGKNRRPSNPSAPRAAPAPTDAGRADFFERRCADLERRCLGLEAANADMVRQLEQDLVEYDKLMESLRVIVAQTNLIASGAVLWCDAAAKSDKKIRTLVKRKAPSLAPVLPPPLGAQPAFLEFSVLPNPLPPRKKSSAPPEA